jgi:hypothetical protein
LPHGPKAGLNINLDVDGLGPIADCSLAAVIACHVIEHLANPVAALREFERVLRRQGRLVLVVPDRTVTFDSVRQPTTLAHVLAKFHQGVTQVDDEEIREFCSAIYFQPPMHPTAVREWHNPQRLDAERFELHRRRSIHVHCWSPEEFASLIVGLLADGLVSWRFVDLYLPGDPRQIEFGLVLQRSASTGRAASNQFVRDWTNAVLGTPDHDPRRIAMFDCALASRPGRECSARCRSFTGRRCYADILQMGTLIQAANESCAAEIRNNELAIPAITEHFREPCRKLACAQRLTLTGVCL